MNDDSLPSMIPIIIHLMLKGWGGCFFFLGYDYFISGDFLLRRGRKAGINSAEGLPFRFSQESVIGKGNKRICL